MRTMALVCALLAGAAMAAEGEGRAWLKTDPTGAAVWLAPAPVKETDKLEYADTGQKTNCMVKMKAGKYMAAFRLQGYEESRIEVRAFGDEILKPDVVKLERTRRAVDILFAQEGWAIVVDKEPAKDSTGAPVTTPGTARLTLGPHEIKLTKDGCAPVVQTVTVDEKTATVEIKGEIKDGPKEAKPKEPAKAGPKQWDIYIGTWKQVNAPGAEPYVISRDGDKYVLRQKWSAWTRASSEFSCNADGSLTFKLPDAQLSAFQPASEQYELLLFAFAGGTFTKSFGPHSENNKPKGLVPNHWTGKVGIEKVEGK